MDYLKMMNPRATQVEARTAELVDLVAYLVWIQCTLTPLGIETSPAIDLTLFGLQESLGHEFIRFVPKVGRSVQIVHLVSGDFKAEFSASRIFFILCLDQHETMSIGIKTGNHFSMDRRVVL